MVGGGELKVLIHVVFYIMVVLWVIRVITTLADKRYGFVKGTEEPLGLARGTIDTFLILVFTLIVLSVLNEPAEAISTKWVLLSYAGVSSIYFLAELRRRSGEAQETRSASPSAGGEARQQE